MAIKRFAGDKFSGLNTDTKPTGVLTGATFYETDTQKVFIYTGSAWTEVDYIAGVVWGDITGTLSNQTDLQNALDLKADDADLTAHENDTANPHDTSLANLIDTTITTPGNRHVAVHDGTDWKNRLLVEADISDLGSYITGVAWGDITGTLSNQTDLQTELNDKQDTSEKGQANGYASLDGSGKVPSSELPALALTDVYVVADITARDALTVQEGDVAIVTDASADPDVTSGSASYIYDGTDWQMLEFPSGGGGTPGGANTQIQYNDSGSFGGSANFTFASGLVGLTGNLRIGEGAAVSTPNHDQATYFVETETIGADDISRVMCRLGNGSDVIIASYIQ